MTEDKKSNRMINRLIDTKMKVKFKTLSEEARIIRTEERKLKDARAISKGEVIRISIPLTPLDGLFNVRSIKAEIEGVNCECCKGIAESVGQKIKRAEERAAKYAALPDEVKEGLLKRHVFGVATLRDHRVHVVRHEARHTHLARMFLLGVPYNKVEEQCHTPPNWDKVESMAQGFSRIEEQEIKQKFAEWKSSFAGTIWYKKGGRVPLSHRPS